MKMLSYSSPPGYRRTKPIRRPKLDGFTDIIDAILEPDADPDVPRKQRHTAYRIFERLRDEHGFTGGYTIVKNYIRARRQCDCSMRLGHGFDLDGHFLLRRRTASGVGSGRT